MDVRKLDRRRILASTHAAEILLHARDRHKAVCRKVVNACDYCRIEGLVRPVCATGAHIRRNGPEISHDKPVRSYFSSIMNDNTICCTTAFLTQQCQNNKSNGWISAEPQITSSSILIAHCCGTTIYWSRTKIIISLSPTGRARSYPASVCSEKYIYEYPKSTIHVPEYVHVLKRTFSSKRPPNPYPNPKPQTQTSTSNPTSHHETTSPNPPKALDTYSPKNPPSISPPIPKSD